ncbi:trans-2-enoyl-CoA reductase family protein [Pseudovibrio exalbescens]|uniref:enoyl-ACP reductase FabV n=1 Tax=Pseudovibrio exalbescens TaxID=197461 RepID=UPI0023650B24|nr:enoyl-ACP reductase FabV [Pseudovibrio exalbescens]MDD7909631.1 trans-2-enoyl-CoA reductase family protein [Pseudovibrio exalbescens]
MKIEPVIKGQVAKTCHPIGCQKAVEDQIAQVRKSKQIKEGPKKVLVLGSSSGFGLASRISLAFGGARADTIGVAFERGPSETGLGTAGWYNSIYFREAAEKEGLIAKNFIGDAFSPAMRQGVVDYIKTEFGGSVDLVVYSLATGIRPDPKTGERIRSSLKTIGEPLTGYTVNLEEDRLQEGVLEAATEQEVADTVRVMGGEDWAEWIEFLSGEGVLAHGCQTVAYSYIGSEITHKIYHEGTLGRAKVHLHGTADVLDAKLKEIGGQAHVAVCKALVTKASVFIPAFSPYILALFKVMKELGLHEGCIEQMQRLFADRLYNGEELVPVDEQRLIRIDDWELRDDVQEKVQVILKELDQNNFQSISDYEGYKKDFLALNGFGLDGVDYEKEVYVDDLSIKMP